MLVEPGKTPQFRTPAGQQDLLRRLEEEAGLSPAPGKPLDPVSLLSPVIEIFVPVTLNGNTMLGFWFDTAGLTHVYVQQAIAPDNIFTQVKIITVRLPFALGLLVFNLGLAMFFVRAFIVATRVAAVESLQGVQKMVQQMIDTIKQTPQQAGRE